MKRYRLNEDRLPSKLPVRFSYKVFKTIKSIEKRNEDNPHSLSNWFDYLNEVKTYISNRVIAWDYNSRHIRFPNGAFFIKDFDYNVGYTIKNNGQNQTYVYVFMMNFKAEEFGLKVPNVNESKRTITQKDLKNIINECVDRCLRKYLSEQTQKIPLNETHTVRTWHYTSFDQAISIIRQNKFKLRQNDDATDECKYKQKGVWYDGYGEMTTPPKYMLCTTRIRDSRVGFSSSFQYGFIQNGWGFCRIELDENAIEYSPSLIVRTERDCLQHKPHIDVYNTKKWKFKNTYDWCTPNWENQHEERILSRVPFIDNAIQYIRRFDFLINNEEELITLNKVLKAKKNFAEKVFVYTNMSDFNSANDRIARTVPL